MASGDIAAVCSGKSLFRRVDRRHPKGAEKPLDVFEKDWLRTLAALQEFAADYPDDVVAGIYLFRVIGILLEPPPNDWDGIVHFSRK